MELTHAGRPVRARAVLSRPALWVPEHPVTVEETPAARSRSRLSAVRRVLPGVVDEALRSADRPVAEIGTVVFVSNAGLPMTPITGWMIDALGFRRGLRQVPVAGAGHAAGSAALDRACDLLAARPGSDVLMVACELGRPVDREPGARRSGDAIAAAVVGGPGGRGLTLRRDGHTTGDFAGLPPDVFRHSGRVLADYGDIASAAVLAVLQRFFDHAGKAPVTTVTSDPGSFL